MTLIVPVKTTPLGVGNTVYLGRARPGSGGSGGSAPSWVPASGFMSPISLNNMTAAADTGNADVFLRDTDLANVLNAYTSTAFCPSYGPLGSIVATGGGHRDRINNAVCRYDLYTRLWSRITNGFPIPIRTGVDYDTVAGNVPAGAIDNAWGEYWTDESRTAVAVGQPCATHMFGTMKGVPASVAGNTNGLLVTMGAGIARVAHYIDLDNPSAGWARLGAPWGAASYSQAGSYGSALVDTLRNRVVCYPFNSNSQGPAITIDLPSRTVGAIPNTFVESYYTSSMYDAADDLYITGDYRFTGPGTGFLTVLDPVTGTKYTPSVSGTQPATGTATMEWDNARRQIVFWTGATNADLYVCQAPANPRTGTWVWSKQTITPTAGVAYQTGVNNMYDRLHYAPAIDAFVAVTRVDGAVQCWKR